VDPAGPVHPAGGVHRLGHDGGGLLAVPRAAEPVPDPQWRRWGDPVLLRLPVLCLRRSGPLEPGRHVASPLTIERPARLRPDGALRPLGRPATRTPGSGRTAAPTDRRRPTPAPARRPPA